MHARRDIGVHDRGEFRHDRRRIGRQVGAAAAEGAIGFVVVGECLGVDILAADQRRAAIQHPELAVLIGVAVVNVGGCVGSEIVDASARLRDLLHDPQLLVADTARRAAFQQDLHCNPCAGARGDELAEAGILERIPLEADAGSRALQQAS